MSWSRMSFKGQTVWVHTDESGRPVLDGEGRAEMKYREGDTKTYRPAPQNLLPGGAASAPPSGASKAYGEKPAAKPAHKPQTGKALPPASAETIHVWTDGACSGNPGPMGIGVVVVIGDRRKEHGEYLGRGTNNVAELTAIQRGLEIARELVPDPGRPIRVYTDSSYAIGLLSQGWKPKANQQLVSELKELVRSYPSLRMVKVEGHAGVPENERCDLLARQAVAQNRY